MSKVIVLSGPSGCGKSTYAQHLLNENYDLYNGWAIVSSDSVRERLYGDAGAQIDHARVFRTVDNDVQAWLAKGYTVIVDATNLKPRDRKSYVEAAQRHGVDAEIHFVVRDLDGCLKGQETRDRKVPEHVVRRMFDAHLKDLNNPVHNFYGEGFSTIHFAKM